MLYLFSLILKISAFLFYFIKKEGITLVFSDTSHLYSNLLCIQNELNSRKIPYKTCKNNKSFKTLFLLLKSKIICIDQSIFFLSNLKFGRDSIVIQLWHGGGLYKKVAFDICKNAQDFKRAKRIHQNISFVNISDKKLRTDYARMFNVKESQILSFGLPRIDKFFQIDSTTNRQKFLQKYPALACKKIYLYAPTFRELYQRREGEILLDIQTINKHFEDKIIIVRNHPSLKIDNQDFIDVSKEPLEWILSISDVLISDYSSIIFDFAFFHRPILLYVPDLKDYLTSNRPLYRTPEELVGKENVAYTQEELILAMQKDNAHCLWEEYMESCKGDSSSKVVDFMLKLL